MFSFEPARFRRRCPYATRMRGGLGKKGDVTIEDRAREDPPHAGSYVSPL